MIYGSVCSGIEAATAAWHPLGWRASFFSEIEAFPRSVLAHHYPETPLHGDFTTIQAGEYEPIDLLVGGTPCQSFSVAGLRGGLDDDRGNLALEYLRLADRLRPRWLVWENVPGVLSSNGGRDFGAILGGMVELGYGVAYRVLDAQYFGVAQRRRRVFVVGYLGDWRRAAAVLFERHSLSGNPAPRREAGKGFAGVLTGGARERGGYSHDDTPLIAASTGDTAHCLNAGGMGRQDYETETLIAHTLKGEGFDASEDGTGRGTPLVPVAFAIQERAVCENPDAGPDGAGFRSDNAAYTLEARTVPQAVAYPINTNALRGDTHAKTPSPDAEGRVRLRDPGLGIGRDGDPADTLQAAGPGAVAIAGSPETMYGVSHASAQEAHPDQALRALRDSVGAEAFAQWGLGILRPFQSPEVLRSEMHGGGVRRPTDDGDKLGDNALSRPKTGAGGAVRALWKAASDGRSPRGWRPPEQLAGELVAHLSELPHQRAQAARFLLGMWRASEGLGLLREALSAVQAAWRPAADEAQPAQPQSAVRRLTPEECEKLQGFLPGYTAVPHRGKPAADGPRYKALGNSMAVPCMAWIGQRIQAVEDLAKTLPVNDTTPHPKEAANDGAALKQTGEAA